MAHVHYGVHRHLEDAANALIKESLAGVTRHRDKSDILTARKEEDRRNREVYVPSGTPDPSQRRGVFTRAWNRERPELNSRDSVGGGWRAPVRRTSSLAEHMAVYGTFEDDDE